MTTPDERIINLSIALAAEFEKMNQIRKVQFCHALLHCQCQGCEVLKKLVTASLANELIRGDGQIT